MKDPMPNPGDGARLDSKDVKLGSSLVEAGQAVTEAVTKAVSPD